jgi:hypothetical protein
MVAVRVVQVAIDEIVDVVAMRHGLVTAPGPVLVSRLMSRTLVLGRASVRVRSGDLDRVLVDVVGMHVMEMAVMEIIDVIAMLDRRVSAAGAVLVRVVGVMWLGTRRHGRLLPLRSARQITTGD